MPGRNARHRGSARASESTTSSLQSTDYFRRSSDLARRLATGCALYRSVFGYVLSDFRSPGSVGRPAGAAVVGANAVGRGLEIYDRIRAPIEHMPPRPVAMTYVHLLPAVSRDRKQRGGRALGTETYDWQETFKLTPGFPA